jgi:N utilization substance protein B
MAESAAAARARARSIARLAAVQALYQMDIAGTDLADILAEFNAGAHARGLDGDIMTDADAGHFRDLVKGVVAAQGGLDPDIDGALAEGWSLTRIDATLRAILRAGAYELSARPDVPFKTVISEYVDLAHAFFDGAEPGVVNGVLDRLARGYRDIG